MQQRLIERLIIAGGRNYQFDDADIISLMKLLPVTEVVSGGASGADHQGEVWAKERGIPVRCFPADWRTHGTAAGPMRNQEMAAYATAVALFPGGKGAASMFREAKKAGLQIFDFRTRCSEHSRGFWDASG